MNKIQIIRQDTLDELKKNISHYHFAFLEKSNDTLISILDKDAFVDSKFILPLIELDMTNKKPFDSELINVKFVFESLKYLTPSQASDERLWVGLAINSFWDYTKYRWNIDSNGTTQQVLNHFFFNYGPKRSLTRNSISRLWWIGKLSYDETRSNPYELTELLCENSNHIQNVLERNTSNNLSITQAFLSGVLKARKEGFIVSKDSLGELSKYMNVLGGTYLLDAIPAKTLEQKIMSRALGMVDSN